MDIKEETYVAWCGKCQKDTLHVQSLGEGYWYGTGFLVQECGECGDFNKDEIEIEESASYDEWYRRAYIVRGDCE